MVLVLLEQALPGFIHRAADSIVCVPPYRSMSLLPFLKRGQRRNYAVMALGHSLFFGAGFQAIQIIQCLMIHWLT
jgi:hypothetical protein